MEYPDIRSIFDVKEFVELEYLALLDWSFTELVKGEHARVLISPGRVDFAGRRNGDVPTTTLACEMTELFLPKLPALEEHFPRGACLYGVGYGFGPGLEAINKAEWSQMGFKLFDVFADGQWLNDFSVRQLGHRLGIPCVPHIGYGNLQQMRERCAAGFPSAYGTEPAKGIVARPLFELSVRGGERVITKAACEGARSNGVKRRRGVRSEWEMRAHD